MTDWIPYGKPWSGAEEYWSDDTFDTSGLAVPGTLIEVRNESGVLRQLLIGDVNPNGGRCGCCSDIGYGEYVTRYRVVYEPPKGEGEAS